ncbi:putative uncharacterized protein DDB_G0277255 [Ylistrum balloti]|uniref:putative uncharacterized protein DDB_G0277255 n=1 Tax=Ylistrum balloti TaxID=509963 RepID=UPI002905E03A|nr:putative uncharacterized protein DDB_G0277255 [Ylistrum balloti]
MLAVPLEPGQAVHANQVQPQVEPPQSPSNLEKELKQQQTKSNTAKAPTNYLPPPPPPLLPQNDAISDEANAMLDNLSFEEIVEDVLSTLKKHPEILKELALDEEQKSGIVIDQEDEHLPTNYQMPPPQLHQMPQRVEKKAGGRYQDHKRGSKYPGSYWKKKYGGKSSSESSENESETEESDESSQMSISKPSSSSSSSSSSSEETSSQESDESSEEYSNYIPQKRVKEIPEETIDLLALPLEGGSKVNEGSKRFHGSRTQKNNERPYTAWTQPEGNPQQLTPNAGNDRLILESPFINSLPLFLPGDLARNKDQELTPEHQAEIEALARMEAENESVVENGGEMGEGEEENAPIKDMEQLQSLENKERKKQEERAKKMNLSADNNNAQSDAEEGELMALANDGGPK